MAEHAQIDAGTSPTEAANTDIPVTEMASPLAKLTGPSVVSEPNADSAGPAVVSAVEQMLSKVDSPEGRLKILQELRKDSSPDSLFGTYKKRDAALKALLPYAESNLEVMNVFIEELERRRWIPDTTGIVLDSLRAGLAVKDQKLVDRLCEIFQDMNGDRPAEPVGGWNLNVKLGAAPSKETIDSISKDLRAMFKQGYLYNGTYTLVSCMVALGNQYGVEKLAKLMNEAHAMVEGWSSPFRLEGQKNAALGFLFFGARALDPLKGSDATHKVVAALLEKSGRPDVIEALTIAGSLSKPAINGDDLRALLTVASPQGKLEVLRKIREEQVTGAREIVVSLTSDQSRKVRTAAYGTLELFDAI